MSDHKRHDGACALEAHELERALDDVVGKTESAQGDAGLLQRLSAAWAEAFDEARGFFRPYGVSIRAFDTCKALTLIYNGSCLRAVAKNRPDRVSRASDVVRRIHDLRGLCRRMAVPPLNAVTAEAIAQGGEQEARAREVLRAAACSPGRDSPEIVQVQRAARRTSMTSSVEGMVRVLRSKDTVFYDYELNPEVFERAPMRADFVADLRKDPNYAACFDAEERVRALVDGVGRFAFMPQAMRALLRKDVANGLRECCELPQFLVDTMATIRVVISTRDPHVLFSRIYSGCYICIAAERAPERLRFMRKLLFALHKTAVLLAEIARPTVAEFLQVKGSDIHPLVERIATARASLGNPATPLDIATNDTRDVEALLAFIEDGEPTKAAAAKAGSGKKAGGKKAEAAGKGPGPEAAAEASGEEAADDGFRHVVPVTSIIRRELQSYLTPVVGYTRDQGAHDLHLLYPPMDILRDPIRDSTGAVYRPQLTPGGVLMFRTDRERDLHVSVFPRTDRTGFHITDERDQENLPHYAFTREGRMRAAHSRRAGVAVAKDNRAEFAHSNAKVASDPRIRELVRATVQHLKRYAAPS